MSRIPSVPMNRLVAGTALLVLAATTTLLAAQERTEVEAVLVPQVERSALVRIRAAGAISTGRLRAAEAGVARLETDRGHLKIPFNSIDSLWVRGNSAGTGALIGAALGAAIGAVVGATSFTDAITCDGTAECPAGKRIRNGLAGALIVGVPTGLLGAAMGAVIPRWKRKFPTG